MLGTISMYPWEQFRISLGYFWGQLKTFGLWHIARPDQWVAEHVEQVLPGGRSRYLASRQLQRTLHEQFFALVQSWTVLISLFIAAASAMLSREKWSPEILALAWVIAYTLLTNAAIAGILSQVADRYQGRVIWLMPLFAGLLLLHRPGDPRRVKSQTRCQDWRAETGARQVLGPKVSSSPDCRFHWPAAGGGIHPPAACPAPVPRGPGAR